MSKTDPDAVMNDVAVLRAQLQLMAQSDGLAHAVSVAASLLGELLLHIRGGTYGSDGVRISEHVLDNLNRTVRNDQTGVHELKIEIGRQPQ